MHLSDIVIEVFLHDLLPLASTHDILNLGCTSKFFAKVCADETLWERRCRVDFKEYMGTAALWDATWKRLYKALSFPRVFVWGYLGDGRRGIEDYQTRGFDSFPNPVEVQLHPGLRLVRLVAGCWSFNALDSEGSIYVWGSLESDLPLTQRMTPSPLGRIQVKSPRRLIMPNPIVDISCGKLHMTALDSKAQVWTFTNWLSPFRLESAMLDCSSSETTPAQVACGRDFSALLMMSGDVLVFWPYRIDPGSFRFTAEEVAQLKANATGALHMPCVTRALRSDPHKLPAVPQLRNAGSLSADSGETTLIKIAALAQQIVGLTGNDHVLKLGDMSHGNDGGFVTTGWEYLDKFNEPLESHVEAPSKLTDITAWCAQTEFAAYSTGTNSRVLMGSGTMSAQTSPDVVQDLQSRAVTAVALGDRHRAVLTANGELLTWGMHAGAPPLGYGAPDNPTPAGPTFPMIPRTFAMVPPGFVQQQMHLPPMVDVPTPVRFDHDADSGKRMLCIAVTTAGTHTGALVISLEEDGQLDTAR
ncbi:regulator of chromosome condensation 1/beta-lactamase-inhibitor protein II [Gloeopeniophorella convolvens]|nr:regulator of chromosome condensation 1/beta-lactamase-inhibitor protein II [Gloeopeniophorella convolvens]